VRKKGLEPLRPFGHQLLRLARLPIPPLPQGAASIPSCSQGDGGTAFAVCRAVQQNGSARKGTNLPPASYLFLRGFKRQPDPEGNREIAMVKFLLWCILLVLCWPLALVALVLYPIVWLLLLPFRVVGIAVTGVLDLIAAVLFLPVRVLRGPRAV
jgi:hypothetical protein